MFEAATIRPLFPGQKDRVGVHRAEASPCPEPKHRTQPKQRLLEQDTWSRLEVELCCGVSRLTVCRSIAPLRIVNPRVAGPSCHVLVSHYGGGMLDGDDISLEISCKEGARLHMGSVGNLHVYKSAGKGSCQRIRGTLDGNAVAVFGPESVVPHAGSIYRQCQEWRVHPDSSLLIAELMAAGRVETGECFAFEEFSGRVSVTMGDRPVLHDVFRFKPSEIDYRDPGILAGRHYVLTIYLIGKRWAGLANLLDSEVARRLSDSDTTLLSAIHPISQTGHILRAVSKRQNDLVEFVDLVYAFLKDDGFLGFNPRERRY
jgi:urease accessory protein